MSKKKHTTLRNLNQCIANELGVTFKTSYEMGKILIECPLERFSASTWNISICTLLRKETKDF